MTLLTGDAGAQMRGAARIGVAGLEGQRQVQDRQLGIGQRQTDLNAIGREDTSQTGAGADILTEIGRLGANAAVKRRGNARPAQIETGFVQAGLGRGQLGARFRHLRFAQGQRAASPSPSDSHSSRASSDSACSRTSA